MVYKIVAKKNSKTTTKSPEPSSTPALSNNAGVVGLSADAAYKEQVLARALKRCSLKPGDLIKVRGTNFYGKVIEIYTRVSDVNWDNKFPTYIHLELDGGTQRMAHHSQINRVGNNRS